MCLPGLIQVRSDIVETSGIMEPHVVKELVCHRTCSPMTEPLLATLLTHPHRGLYGPIASQGSYLQLPLPCGLEIQALAYEARGIDLMYARTITIKERRGTGERKKMGMEEGGRWRGGLIPVFTEMKLPGGLHGRKLPRGPLPTSASPSHLQCSPSICTFMCIFHFSDFELLSPSWLCLFVWKTYSGFFLLNKAPLPSSPRSLLSCQ